MVAAMVLVVVFLAAMVLVAVVLVVVLVVVFLAATARHRARCRPSVSGEALAGSRRHWLEAGLEAGGRRWRPWCWWSCFWRPWC